ncbi:PAS domain-containing sensor histidine kinase [Clostridium senegalense]|uniref:sensor histidine kinase n=1 Tax=Clostridium senegalense TaxID=1465809 RepID=UPI001C112AF6|nr:PAS domain-containing sensor histidine kinase [Clostridium senegalense]MBU5226455.1 PAS domain-containing sensor histidine kinase [Clostridium senegalense]
MIIKDEDMFFLENLNNPICILSEKNNVLYKNKSFKKLIKELKEKDEVYNEHIEMLSYEYLKNFKNMGDFKIQVKSKDQEDFCFKIIINDSIYNEKPVFLISIEKKLVSNKCHLNGYGMIKGEEFVSDYFKIHRRCLQKEFDVNAVINSEMVNKVLLYSPNIIMIKKDRKIIFANKAAQHLLRISDASEIIGKEFYEIVNFEAKEKKYSKNIFENEYYYYNALPVSQVKLKTFKGKQIYVDVCFMSFFEDEDEFSVLIAKDISKRVKIEENLVRNEEYYKKLLEFLPYGVAIVNNNKITFSNDSFATMLGEKTIQDTLNNNLAQYIKDEDKKIIKNMQKNIFGELKQVEFTEMKLLRKDGKELDIELGASPFLFENNLSAILVMCDITERKNAERDKFKLKQALKYDRLKTEFIANISHELKTPLNIILSIVQLFELKKRGNENIDSITGKRYLQVVTQNCYRLLRLINNLIDISRIDVGHLKMNFGNYDIVKIIEDITMSTVEHIESKNLNLIFDTEIEEKIIGVDRENMERIMLNLLSNAIKCSNENGTIWVNIYDSGDFIEIAVKDNGVGIPKEMQERIFERFVQSSPLFTRTYEGSGIGLSLVKALVDAHGGKITVESKVGVGSEFVVSLPNRLSKKDPTFLQSKLIEDNKSNNVERIKIEFSDIYN